MPLAAPLLNTSLPTLPLVRRGKVRDVFAVDDGLLIVASDRISAFDYVLGTGIPDKGKILTQLSAFWFESLREVTPHHLISTNPDEYPPAARAYRDLLAGRSMLVRKTAPLPIECVARGYLAGSGWIDYQRTGEVCGVRLPPGLVEAARLPEPIFTPATKAEHGHDENIGEADAARELGSELVARLKTLTLELYDRGARHAEGCGIVVADTKFEFGMDETGQLLLIDEILTPDSSRFWPRDHYRPGGPQVSFDKQYVRDYLEQIRWNKQPPAPSLPAEVVERTRDKYLEAFTRLTGKRLA